jgi:hypothetical protein
MANKRRQGRQQVIADLIGKNRWTAGAELGVYEGQTLFFLLTRFPRLHMIGVDHWKRTGGLVQNKDTGEAPYANKQMEAIRAKVFKQARPFGDRCVLIEADTTTAASCVLDKTLDFIFIDADHSTSAVISDIALWSPKLKPKGVLLGHDVNWPSVRRALEATIGTWTELDANVWYRPPQADDAGG